MKKIQYLGHILSTKGIKPLPLKTQAIKNMHLPNMPKPVCAFLGIVEYIFLHLSTPIRPG